jgi:excisionase family DNA binding protein
MERDRLTLNVPEAARLIGISRAHAYELIRLGRIPSLRLGHRIVIPYKALEEFLDTAVTARP